MRLAVTENAQDERLLEDFVLACSRYEAQEGKRILLRIKSPEALRRIAGSFAVASIRDLARDRLRELEQRLAERRRDDATRQVAAISDPVELASIAEDESAETTLRGAAAGAVTDQTILKRWAIEHDHGSFLSMPERITDPDDIAEVARLAKDRRTRAAAAERMGDRATLEDMARGHWGAWHQAAKRLGGYGCASCGTTVLPVGESPVPCICPSCGAENHDWEHVSGEIVHRDYSSGVSYDFCRRCGKRDKVFAHGIQHGE